jgi:O-antigen ligase
MRDLAASSQLRRTNVNSIQPAVQFHTKIRQPAPHSILEFTFASYVVIAYLLFRLGTIHEYLANRGINTHYNYFFVPVMLGLVVVGGQIFLVTYTPVGKWMTAFLAWMAITVAASSWRGGSAIVLRDYYVDGFVLFLAVASFTSSTAVCTRVMSTAAVAMAFFDFVVLRGGGSAMGRLDLQGSRFGNPNELAMHLLFLAPLAIGVVLMKKRSIVSLIAVFGLLTGTVLFFRTGSRGGLVALVAVVALGFLVLPRSKKMPVFILLLVSVVAASMILPKSTLDRYRTIVSETTEADAGDARLIESARGSSEQRKGAFWRSVSITMEHPLFGVGPGQYGNFAWSREKARGLHIADLGTHNSYTQVASEMGLIGFILYTGILCSCWRRLKRTRKVLRDIPALRPLFRITWCVTFSLVVYSIGTIFIHMAYSFYLPLLAGLTVSLSIAADQELRVFRNDEDVV